MENQRKKTTIYQPSRWTLFLIILVFPPAGLVLLWLRSHTNIWKKILLSIPIIILGLLYIPLTFIAGIVSGIIEPTGGMTGFVFRHRNDYQTLEQSRKEQESLANTTAEIDFHAYWTGFRGPNRDGHYADGPILTQWKEDGLPLVWKQPVGGGYSSFAIANGMAYTLEQRQDEEYAVAYDLTTGTERWTHHWPGHFQEALGGDGPRSTPTWDEDRLYAAGALGDLWCLDAVNGETIWHINLLEDNATENLYYGIASSPLVVDEKLIVQPGAQNGNSIVAYHKETGEKIWGSLNDEAQYISPILATIAGKRQIVTITKHRIVGLEIEDGTLLWEHPWENKSGILISQPVVIGENRIFLSGGYGKGCEMISVTQDKGVWSVKSLWKNRHMKNKFASSVYYNGYIYGLDESILACIDPKTGERKWKGGRYGYGQFLLADGYLILISERGELVFIKATPEQHVELARFQAIEGKTWNVPAMSDGYLLVRNAYEMACFRIAPDEI